MLVTEHFVFTHLPRTGGTFIADLIKRFFPSVREVGYHLPRMMLPKEYAHLPVLGGVRNPWDFYISWYKHQISQAGNSPLFCGVSDNRKLDFVETTRNALDLCLSEGSLDCLIQNLPDDFDYQKKHVPNVTKNIMRRIQGSGLGLYSFRFNLMFEPSEDVFFCRVESLRTDLLTFFERVRVLNNPLRDAVLNVEKKNVSDHDHYSAYYSPELAELVSLRERALIERFRYKFERRRAVDDA
ncbi:MAG: hypothetical protein FJ145_04840 [Deltaproteobacteria bacterium]|nr:hypothetical protein [Deltaproteobacteria bacterium]